MMNDAIFIQARSSSTRFPKKAFAKIGQQEIIIHLIKNLENSKIQIILCLPEDEKEIWEKFTNGFLDTKIYFGKHDDVACRFISAAKKFGIKNIVRVTGDNPFSSAKICKLTLLKLKEGFDYVSSKWDDGTNIPRGIGCEAFTLAALESAYDNNTCPADREHVSELFDKSEFQRNIILDPYNAGDVDLRDGALSIDHEIQLKVVNDIFQ